MADEYPLVANAPDVYLISLAPKKEGELLGMLTLINLSEDDAEGVRIHLPPALRETSQCLTVAKDGTLVPLDAAIEADTLCLHTPIPCCTPLYIILKK